MYYLYYERVKCGSADKYIKVAPQSRQDSVGQVSVQMCETGKLGEWNNKNGSVVTSDGTHCSNVKTVNIKLQLDFSVVLSVFLTL